MDLQDILGDPIGTGIAPAITATNSLPQYKAPIEIRITQVSGGYLINKFGQALEVCTTLNEVQSEVDSYFQPAPPAVTIGTPVDTAPVQASGNTELAQ